MKINCIIIEDEPIALEKTKNYVLKIPSLNLLATFDNGADALVYLNSNKVDLLFLDIKMDELSGIQLLESTKISSEVVFTTAYNEYALKGYDLNVTDYLLKPFTFERFMQAVEKAQNNLSKKEVGLEKRFIFVKTEYRLEKLLLDDILYIEGMGDYRRIHTIGKKIMTLQTFREFELEISSDIIYRVHKSFMVSIGKIESIERDRIRIGDIIIPISETYKRGFLEVINHGSK